MTPTALRRVLLALVGTGPVPDLSALAERDWQALDRLAAQHRLQPLLHFQHRESPDIPPAVSAGWAAAYRAQAILALSQRAELDRTVALLRRAGLAPLALKGAWLGSHAYPHPALRPLRDIDLLLDPGSVVAGFEVLGAAGYRQIEPTALALADLIRTDKHLPPLLSPGGTVVELHHRLWEPDGRLDHASPLEIDAAVRRAAVTEADGLSYPAPADMLAHLIVHAVYSHRLDCGPLLLADIDYLLQVRTIDWAVFWDRAAAEGWRGGARMVLALVERWRDAGSIVLTASAGPDVPAALLDDAADLLLQDLDSRHSAAVLASVRRQGWRGLADRLRGRTQSQDGGVQRDLDVHGGYAAWAGSRLRRTLHDLVRPGPRHQGQALARLSQWLDRSA